MRTIAKMNVTIIDRIFSGAASEGKKNIMKTADDSNEMKAGQSLKTAAKRNQRLRKIRKLSEALVFANCFLVVFITDHTALLSLIIIQLVLAVIVCRLLKHEYSN